MKTGVPPAAMDDHECPHCGVGLRGLACPGCGAFYEKIWGVPFIGENERADALGLIEIAAIGTVSEDLQLPRDVVQTRDGLCERYHAAANKEMFIKRNPEAQIWQFPFRYDEWRAHNLLTQGLDLHGWRVLNIGAGQGFDSQRLSLNGASVTALEYNPVLAKAGQASFPHIRWIGGFSHALPFKSASFDAVFCNAALHHMRDVPAAIAEALRVLRPGGLLVTAGDPFRSDNATQRHELEVFDRHEHALRGINEQIPPFSDFARTFEENPGCAEAEVFTYILYGGRSGRGPNLTDWTSWDLPTDGNMLRQRSGNIALRARLLNDWPHPRLLQRAGVLRPAAYAALLHDEPAAVSEIASIMPREYINPPFGNEPSKFDLLSGWRLAGGARGVRTAYRRGRWFLARNGERYLSFSLRSPEPANFSILIDGKPVQRLAAGASWERVETDLAPVPHSKRYVLEIRREEKAGDFEDNCFQVKNRRVHKPGLISHAARRFFGREMKSAAKPLP